MTWEQPPVADLQRCIDCGQDVSGWRNGPPLAGRHVVRCEACAERRMGRRQRARQEREDRGAMERAGEAGLGLGGYVLVLAGSGPYANGLPEDAEALAVELVRALRRAGHQVRSARLVPALGPPLEVGPS